MAAARRDGKHFLNATVNHAAIVVEHLFRDAYKRVDILSHSLDARVYGRIRVIRQADEFLEKRGRTLRILLEEDNEESRVGHPFLRCCKGFKNQVELRIVPKQVQKLYRLHLLVTDAHSYRVEMDKSKIDAVVAFGRRSNAERFGNIFNSVWNRSASNVIRFSDG